MLTVKKSAQFLSALDAPRFSHSSASERHHLLHAHLPHAHLPHAQYRPLGICHTCGDIERGHLGVTGRPDRGPFDRIAKPQPILVDEHVKLGLTLC